MKTLSSNPLLDLILKNIILAGVYVLLGRVALLLAIPPGYAMAIYPPAGIALGMVLIGGYRLAPGVAFGSLCLNMWIGWETQQALTMTSTLPATAIALGAMIQASFGAYLIRRMAGYPNPLDSNASILKFMLYGGVLGSIANASIGVASLYYAGLVPSSAVAVNWATWWAGDTLGVIVFAPTCLVLFGEPRQVWRTRYYTVMLPQLVTLLAVIVAFVVVREWEQKRLELEWQYRARNVATALQTQLDFYVESQRHVNGFFSNADSVSAKQFKGFVSHLVDTHPALVAIQWVPKVTHPERSDFERSLAALGHASKQVKERDPVRGMVPAGRRDDYYPIYFVEPVIGNEIVIGLDVASTPNRSAIIADARDTGLPVATAPLQLAQEKSGKLSSVLITAAYDNKRLTAQLSDRRGAFIGVTQSVLHVGDILGGLLDSEKRDRILIKLHDAAGDAGRQDYFDTIGKDIASSAVRISLDFSGRELIFQAQPSAIYQAEHIPWAAWISLVGGMLFTGLLGMYFLVSSGRSFAIESLVHQRTRELHDSEERIQTILDNAADGIMTLDFSGRIDLANRAARKLTGYSSEALREKGLDALFTDVNGQLIFHRDLVVGEDGRATVRKESICTRQDGSQIPVELAIVQIERDDHHLYIVILHDLTERKRADRIKGEFVSAVSHELRTPLTSICGSLGLLVGGVAGEVPEKAMKLLNLANDNAERLHLLINDILDFEKLEYGGMLFKMEPWQLSSLVNKSVEYNTGYAEKFSVTIQQHESECDDVMVTVDDNRFIQVLSNLISNAIKFSHPQGSVEIAQERIGDRVRVSVRDHGIGIADEFRPRIFSKFSQGDAEASRKYAGTGLGLSLAKSMMEKMGGSIGFDSVVGQGSTFYVELPVKPAHTA